MATDAYILGIDEGTTGVTTTLVNERGEIVEKAYAEIPQYYPRSGWVEQDADEIWNATASAVSDLLAKRPATILAIGITNQRETTILWDRASSKPVHRAIVWQCRRTSSVCDSLRARGLIDTIADKTGLVIDPYFSATKVQWLLDHVDGARDAVDRLAFGTVDTWLIWKLTDGTSHVTDYTNASRTMLFDIDRRAWDDDLLNLFDTPRSLLPEVRPSSGAFGETRGVGFLPDGIPIYGVAGDQQAALFGQTCFDVGSVKNTYGTGCFLLMNAGHERPRSQHGLLTTLACDGEGNPVYALEGSVFVAGALVQWLRDGIDILESAADSEALAMSVSDSDGVVIVPAFTGLGAPYWDADARGAVFGLTRGTTRAHLVRAALESIAHQSADVIEAMQHDAGTTLPRLLVDGGATPNDFLMQFQADMLGVPVERPAQVETTVLGAAYLAGLQLGMWNADALRDIHRIERRFEPSLNAADRDAKRREWRVAINRLLRKPNG
ncbi:MAG: glycerol kinase GlpK [Candidatus Poribacteria bacterium]|nr:glycerol kinase GlpK [Candidatus Poribacteria bacterium]